MSNFVMLDLETLGTVPGCSVVAIGAVRATHDGWPLERFYRTVSRASCRDCGLFEQRDALDWWTRQPLAARAILSDEVQKDATSLPAALEDFNTFLHSCGPRIEVYGNGSEFDNAILAAAAHAAGVKLAWHPFSQRCYRTIKNLAPGVRLRRIGTHHNAVDDARSQAAHLGEVRAALALTSDRLADAETFIARMADRYRARTARRILGVRIPTISRACAFDAARATWDVAVTDGTIPLTGPVLASGMASELVDADLEHWVD